MEKADYTIKGTQSTPQPPTPTPQEFGLCDHIWSPYRGSAGGGYNGGVDTTGTPP